jgi:glycosyltransferase involved in cell wall biosynthesis
MNSEPKIVVIFAAKNEENTIKNSIQTANKSCYEPSVIVVDVYATDKTSELALNAGAVVIQQSKQMFPGKGFSYEGRIERS